MTKNTSVPAYLDGIGREIEIMRRLIHEAAEKQSVSLTFEEQLSPFDSTGKNTHALARLLKALRDLMHEELDPPTLMR